MFNLTPYRKHNEVSYYDPFQMMDEMERRFWGSNGMSSFKTDIRDEGGAYVLEAELPGFQKEDINIQLSDNYLTITAEHRTESEEKDKKGNYIRKERYSGSMSRSFYVGDGISEDDIHGKFENGILQLDVPKKEAKAVETKKRICIEG